MEVNLTGVHHSVSRGIPGGNAARGSIASSHVKLSLSSSLHVCAFIYLLLLVYKWVDKDASALRIRPLPGATVASAAATATASHLIIDSNSRGEGSKRKPLERWSRVILCYFFFSKLMYWIRDNALRNRATVELQAEEQQQQPQQVLQLSVHFTKSRFNNIILLIITLLDFKYVVDIKGDCYYSEGGGGGGVSYNERNSSNNNYESTCICTIIGCTEMESSSLR